MAVWREAGHKYQGVCVNCARVQGDIDNDMYRPQLQLQMLPELCKIVRKPKAANVEVDVSIGYDVSCLRIGDVQLTRLECWSWQSYTA